MPWSASIKKERRRGPLSGHSELARPSRRPLLRQGLRRLTLILIPLLLVALALALIGWNILSGREGREGETPTPAAGVKRAAPHARAPAAGATGAANTDARRRLGVGERAVSVYAHDAAGMLSSRVRGDPERIYVPNSESNTLDMIDPRSRRVIARYRVGALPQHVVPSYDLRTLYVLDDAGNSLTPLDPRTGRPKGRPVHVDDPYNLYFTPDGRSAIVVAERERRLDFRDPHSFRLQKALHVPCAGVDHLDFTADGRYAVASCEFSSQLIKVGLRRRRVVANLTLDRGAGSPQDVKLSPDGRTFYVADKNADGVWLVDARRFRIRGFLRTGLGAHGLYVSRDGRSLYVSNRAEGSVSVVRFATRRVVATWRIPGGGSPDMGGVSPNGNVLWLSGRWDGVVYALSTANGRLVAKIPVGASPHGLCVWPQPGRYSLGHTGVMR